MEELKTQYQIAQLISKEIVGEITADEKQTLEAWLKESVENQNLYTKIKQREKIEERNEFVSNLDMKAAWTKIGQEIKPQKKTIRLKEWGLRIAAVFLIGFFVGTVYYITNDNTIIDTELAEIKIEPGSSKAVLQLHNGESLQLEDELNNSIVEKDGTHISNSKGKLAYAALNETPSQLLYNTVQVPVGGEYDLILSDGTKVSLNSQSQIKYPVQFSADKRKVWVEGEVHFDVAHDKSKPFIVDVKDVEIEVLGTEFNIEAYADQNSIVTTLVKGSVKLTKGDESILIKPNQQASISKDERMFAVETVNAKNYSLWKDGIFYFEEASLETIMLRLERWYGVKLFYMNQEIKKKRFSMEVKRYTNIEDILDILSRTEKVHFDVKSNVVVIMN